GVADRDLDTREVAVGQRDVLDGADRPAADLHVVALDQLAGVLEVDVVGLAAAAAKDDDGDDHHREGQGRDRGDPGDRPGLDRARRTPLRTRPWHLSGRSWSDRLEV